MRWLRGRAVPYDAPTLIGSPTGDAFTETVAQGAFRRSLKETRSRVPLLGQHNAKSLPIGSAREWDDQPDGLYAVWDLANTREAREVYWLIDAGHVSALSVGFQPIVSDWTLGRDGRPDRVTRVEARLLEVSVVTLGAYEDARIIGWGHAAPQGVVPTPRLDAAKAWDLTAVA